MIDRNAEEGVTWISSYVSEDKRTTFCVYDGPNPEAIRKTAPATTSRRPDHAGPRARSIPLRVKEHGMTRKRDRTHRRSARTRMALALRPAVPAAQAKSRHSYSSTLQSTALSTGSGYPAPGGTAVLAGTWKSKLFGDGSVVDHVKITGQPDLTTFAFKGTEVCFAAAGTIRDTFTGTAVVLQPDGPRSSRQGHVHRRLGRLQGRQGHLHVHRRHGARIPRRQRPFGRDAHLLDSLPSSPEFIASGL